MKKILVLDKDNLNRPVIAKIAEQMNLDFDMVDNGERAFECIRDNRYDLILMDLNIPGMSRFKFLKNIRENNDPKIAETKIVCFFAGNRNIIEPIKDFINSLLPRFIRFEELKMAISSHLK